MTGLPAGDVKLFGVDWCTRARHLKQPNFAAAAIQHKQCRATRVERRSGKRLNRQKPQKSRAYIRSSSRNKQSTGTIGVTTPGRVTELSRMSGRLVAPMMKTILDGPTPSISVKIWLITLTKKRGKIHAANDLKRVLPTNKKGSQKQPTLVLLLWRADGDISRERNTHATNHDEGERGTKASGRFSCTAKKKNQHQQHPRDKTQQPKPHPSTTHLSIHLPWYISINLSISPVPNVTATSTAARPPPAPGDRIHLIEEEDARRCGSGLVEQLADVRLALSKPH